MKILTLTFQKAYSSPLKDEGMFSESFEVIHSSQDD